MKKTIRLTEGDLTRIIKRILKEQSDTEIDLGPESGIPTEVPIKTQIKEIFASLVSKYGINKLCDSRANEQFPTDNNVMKLQSLLNQLRKMSRYFGDKYQEFTEDGTFGFEEQALFCKGSRKPVMNYEDLAQCLKKEGFQINDASNYKFDAALQLNNNSVIEVMSSPRGETSITVRRLQKFGSTIKTTPKKEFDFRGMGCDRIKETIRGMISSEGYTS